MILVLLVLWIYLIQSRLDKLNEIASFSAVSLYHIDKELSNGKLDQAKRSSRETLDLITKFNKTQVFKGRYWEMFNDYIDGISK
jgi:hypothetical protein